MLIFIVTSDYRKPGNSENCFKHKKNPLKIITVLSILMYSLLA